MSKKNLNQLEIKLQTQTESINFKPTMIKTPIVSPNDTDSGSLDQLELLKQSNEKNIIYFSDKTPVISSNIQSFLRDANRIVSLSRRAEAQSEIGLEKDVSKLEEKKEKLTSELNDHVVKKTREGKDNITDLNKKDKLTRDIQQITSEIEKKNALLSKKREESNLSSDQKRLMKFTRDDDSIERELAKYESKYPNISFITWESISLIDKNNTYLIFTNEDLANYLFYYIEQNDTSNLNADKETKDIILENAKFISKLFITPKTIIQKSEGGDETEDFRIPELTLLSDSIKEKNDGTKSVFEVTFKVTIDPVIENNLLKITLETRGDFKTIVDYKPQFSIKDINPEYTKIYIPLIKIKEDYLKSISLAELNITDYREIFFKPLVLYKFIEDIKEGGFYTKSDELAQDIIESNILLIVKLLFHEKGMRYIGNKPNHVYLSGNEYEIQSYKIKETDKDGEFETPLLSNKSNRNNIYSIDVVLILLNTSKPVTIARKIKVNCPERAKNLDKLIKELKISDTFSFFKKYKKIEEENKMAEAQKIYFSKPDNRSKVKGGAYNRGHLNTRKLMLQVLKKNIKKTKKHKPENRNRNRNRNTKNRNRNRNTQHYYKRKYTLPRRRRSQKHT